MLRAIGIVRFCNAMQIVTVILYRLQLVMADRTANRPLDPKNDNTEYQINEIFEIVRTFDKKPLENFLNEWFSQTETPKWPPIFINNSTRISISEIKDGRIFASSINCYFNSQLRINFRTSKDFIVDVQHRNFENFWCSVGSFMFRSEFSGISIEPWDNVTYSIKPIFTSSFFETVNRMKYDENVTCDLSSNEEEKSRTLKILNDMMLTDSFEGKYTPNLKYQKIFYKCLHPHGQTFNEKHKNDYVRFEPYQNMAAFPWITDHNELIITGLNNFSSLAIDFEQNNNYDLRLKRVEVQWNIGSTEQKQHTIKVYGLSIRGNMDHLIDQANVRIGRAYDTTAILNTILQQKLEKLMTSGIKETIEKISHVTSSFTGTINDILRSSDRDTFKNSFMAEQDKLNPYSKIKIEAFQLERITCADENLNISKISMKKITGHAEVDFQHSINANQVNRFLVSVDIFIKEATIHISLQQYPNSMEKTVHISPDNPETTIMITSKYHPLNRTERILIGKQIFGGFVDGVRENILKAAKSTFSPILNICKNDRHQYFTIIHDYWVNTVNPFSIWQTDVTVKGFWNFNQINMQYEGENVIIDGLRIENVTGSIKMNQIFGSNETKMWNYNMSYFLLTINHSGKSIRVQFPAPEEYSIILVNPSNTSLSAQNKKEILERFQYTVASYIEQSIYNDSNYRAMFQTSINNVITETMKDKLSRYDVSSEFVIWLTKLLLKSFSYINLGFSTELQSGHRVYSVIWEKLLIIQKMRIEDTSPKYQSNLVGIVVCDKEDMPKEYFDFKIWSDCAKNVSDEECKFNFQEIEIDSLQNNFTQNDSLKSELEQSIRLNLKDSFHTWYKLGFGTPNISQEHFYLIEGTIDYSSDYFSKYFIRLHGLQNFESFRDNITFPVHEFEIKFTNLIANITWVQNIGAFPSKRPQTMIVNIDEIILTAEISILLNRLIFTDRSQLLLSKKENPRAVEKLTETVVPIILKSMQLKILYAFYEN